MKFRIALAVSLLGMHLARGATVDVYVNSGTVQSPPGAAPQIDAVTFINEGSFEVHDLSPNPLPYQTANTRFFQNTANATMAGHPGYLFEHVSGNVRAPMTTWENRGSISSFGNATNALFSFSTANWLLVNSDSIVSSGNLNASEAGLIRLTGNTVNVARGRLRAASPFENAFFSGAFYLYSTNYFHDQGITDVYWGGGTNNTMGGGGTDMVLNGFLPNFDINSIRSAQHSVVQRFGSTLFTNNFNVVPSFPKGVVTSTHVSRTPTDVFVQTVLVVTNFFDTNLVPEIKFYPTFFGGPAVVQVGFHSVERDIVLDRDVRSSLYLIDGLMGRTNVTLARNSQLGANTRKPDTYAISKGPYDFGAFAVDGNASYSEYPLYSTNYTTNVVPVTYAAYSAQLSLQNLGGSDPTNLPGRIELIGQNVNLRDSRFRAESIVSITANNLLNTNLARVSAPYASFDLGTTQPQLLISNLSPATVNRLYGNISAWSAVWDNNDTRFQGTNYHFHVLIVDHTLQTTLPVTVTKLLARAPRILLDDFLNVNQRLRLDAPSVHVRSRGGLVFPSSWGWGSSNMLNIVNFTNDGVVSLTGAAVLGTDRGYEYANIINRGTFSANSYSILADYAENSGSMLAQSGAFRFNGRKICLLGAPFTPQVTITTNIFIFPTLTTNYVTNVTYTGAANITTRGELAITANSVILSNAVLQAGSAVPAGIVITPAVRLTDSGTRGTNYWITSGGIRIMQRPTSLSDLMGTYATVTAPSGTIAQNVWAANDVGAISLGYSNNLALGKLTLDGGEESVIRFAGLAGKKNAIYVDYLELLNNATNFDRPDPSQLGLVIDPSLTVYFAHANMDAAKLDGKQNGRIKWVKGFMGPLSTTNIVYPSGAVYPVNISLARHKDFDSDGDGTPNIKDPTPVYSPESVNLTIGRDTQPGRVLLSWQALANSTSHVEYKSPIGAPGPWQLLRSTTAPSNMRISMSDPATGAGRTQRIYRVRVDLPPQ